MLAVWLFLIYERMGIASDVSNGQQDNNFTVSGAEQLGSDIDVGELIAICVSENDRRLAPYDNAPEAPALRAIHGPAGAEVHRPKEEGCAMKIGSPEHRDTFCRHFMQTYTEFDPDTLPWPDLDEAALQRLKSVPFWEEVFYTERRAGAIVAEFVKTIKDPVMKEAVALQGFEEARHAKLIRVMIEKYGIDAAERPLEDVSDNVETRVQGFRFRRVHGFLSGLRRLQDRHAVGIPAQGNVQHLRDPDVRGDAPHRLLRQLDGL